MKSPRNILSPRWSGFFIILAGGGSIGFGISLGGSALEMLAERGRAVPWLKGLPEEKDGERLVLSRMASDQLKPSPPPEAPGLPPSLTSLNACAPKLTRLAKEGEDGGLIVARAVSSSSSTAGSSPKLFLKSGELDTEDVATLARRCSPKAGKGDWLEGFVVRPRAVIDAPRRCWTEGVEGLPADGGEEDIADEVVFERGLNMSTKDDRRRCCGSGGEGGGFWTDIWSEKAGLELFIRISHRSEITRDGVDSCMPVPEAEVRIDLTALKGVSSGTKSHVIDPWLVGVVGLGSVNNG